MENKTDLNKVIGFVLIGALFFWFAMVNKPKEQPKASAQVGDTTAVVTDTTETLAQAQTSGVAMSDSVKAFALQTELGPFYTSDQTAEEQVYTLSNEVLTVRISSRGAAVQGARLNAYKTYDSLSVDLFRSDETADVLLEGVKSLPMSKLNFRLLDQSPGQVRLGARSNTGSDLIVEYTLEEGGYRLNSRIVSAGTGVKPTAMAWSMNAHRFEKNRKNENLQTGLYYQYAGKDKRDHLSLSKADTEEREQLEWVAVKQQYFSSILRVPSGIVSAKMESLPLEQDSLLKAFNSRLAFTASESLDLEWYFVPNKYDVLKVYDLNFDELIPLGWGILGWINKGAVISLFRWLEHAGLNYGLIILIIALVFKIVLLPLTYSSYLSMAKMRVLKPEMDELNAKFEGKDPMKKQTAVMELYRSAGVNPLGGCVPVLLQFPILIALFNFFPAAFELRHQAFLWAQDLSTYDSIFNLPFEIPFYGSHVSLFTLLMTVSTLLYTYFNNQLSPQNEQMAQLKWMMYLMPIVFLGVFNNYSAGLSYYYFVANMLTFSQQWLIRQFVDDDAIHAKIQQKKAKGPAGPSKFQQRLEKLTQQKEQSEELVKLNRQMRRKK
ncbi:membrane protein insertase YidC [bacterium]|nr:membrane protein insertase YidC [bacterium]